MRFHRSKSPHFLLYIRHLGLLAAHHTYFVVFGMSSPPLSPSRSVEFKASAAPFVPSFCLPPSSSPPPSPTRHANQRPRLPQSPSNNDPRSRSTPTNDSPPPSPSSLSRSVRLGKNPAATPASPLKSAAHTGAAVEAQGRLGVFSGSGGGSGKKGRGRGEVLTNVVEFQFIKKDESVHTVSNCLCCMMSNTVLTLLLTLQGASSLPPLSAREKRQLKAAAALRSEYRELCVHRAVQLLFQSH